MCVSGGQGKVLTALENFWENGLFDVIWIDYVAMPSR